MLPITIYALFKSLDWLTFVFLLRRVGFHPRSEIDKLLVNIWFICFTQWNCKEVTTFWTISSNYGGDDSIYGILGCQQITCGDKWIAVPPCPRLSVKNHQIVCLVVFVFLLNVLHLFQKDSASCFENVLVCVHTVIMSEASLTNDDIGLLLPALPFIIIS